MLDIHGQSYMVVEWLYSSLNYFNKKNYTSSFTVNNTNLTKNIFPTNFLPKSNELVVDVKKFFFHCHDRISFYDKNVLGNRFFCSLVSVGFFCIDLFFVEVVSIFSIPANIFF